MIISKNNVTVNILILETIQFNVLLWCNYTNKYYVILFNILTKGFGLV